MRLDDIIAEALDVDPYGSPESLADRVWPRLDKQDLYVLFVAEIQKRQRGRTRYAERGADISLFRSLVTDHPVVRSATPTEGVERLRALMAEPLRLGNGLVTEWGKATLDELRQRREMLAKKRDGIDETIDKLDEAIRVLEETGAPCLSALVEDGLAVVA